MTPDQCRAARALINWTQPKLAETAKLGLSTVVDFERERREIPSETIALMQDALEFAGIIFLSENGEGIGVRLRKKRQTK